ncbi:MAG TPA: YceI family protein [Tepidisphaeraceae bacterium]
MRRSAFIVVFFGALVLGVSLRADTFKVDPVHSFVVFKIGHLDVGYVWGEFASPAGTITIDDSDASKSAINVEIKSDNLVTTNEARNKHLKSPDFFDVKQFPTISFKSTAVKKTADKTYEVSGDLTLHGVTKPLTLTLNKLAEGDKGAMFGYRAGFEADFSVRRSDFGMTSLMNVVGDEVKLFVNLEGTK